ncbi:PREDICTED: chromatin assembly factor 1 subunit A-like [Drosophila arizonae]|uniref:Chromatin assembly factor 1 subunit A-like n=1 Tax=Drosophila arizonae TaxID=7263 RepID=A0ABM1PLL0_DROAR|nr:PREDICTED: chromatin assembly factor 1 subunit A-like [Drosophila arizonae]
MSGMQSMARGVGAIVQVGRRFSTTSRFSLLGSVGDSYHGLLLKQKSAVKNIQNVNHISRPLEDKTTLRLVLQKLDDRRHKTTSSTDNDGNSFGRKQSDEKPSALSPYIPSKNNNQEKLIFISGEIFLPVRRPEFVSPSAEVISTEEEEASVDEVPEPISGDQKMEQGIEEKKEKPIVMIEHVFYEKQKDENQISEVEAICEHEKDEKPIEVSGEIEWGQENEESLVGLSDEQIYGKQIEEMSLIQDYEILSTEEMEQQTSDMAEEITSRKQREEKPIQDEITNMKQKEDDEILSTEEIEEQPFDMAEEITSRKQREEKPFQDDEIVSRKQKEEKSFLQDDEILSTEEMEQQTFDITEEISSRKQREEKPFQHDEIISRKQKEEEYFHQDDEILSTDQIQQKSFDMAEEITNRKQREEKPIGKISQAFLKESPEVAELTKPEEIFSSDQRKENQQ